MEDPVKKKILYAITKSNWGGAGVYVYTLATHAKEAGYTVAVAVGTEAPIGGREGVLSQKLAVAGVRTIFQGSLSRDISVTREVRAFFSLLRTIRAEKPDILHLNSSKAGGLGALAGRLSGVPNIVFTAHGWAHREARNPLSRVLIWFLSWMTVALAHRVIAVSEYDTENAPVLFSRNKIRCVYNGIDEGRLESQEEARARLKSFFPRAQENEVPLLVTIGELTKNKSQKTLLAALARIHAPYQAILIGEGEEREKLVRLSRELGIEEKVAFPGFIPDAMKILPGADIFILPSLKEGFPFVLLEAGLAGIPVIATAVGGVPELIRDGETGLLVPREDSEAMARTLTMLLENKDKQTQLGAALFSFVRTSFTARAMIRETFSLY